jgi:hypothetical protein
MFGRRAIAAAGAIVKRAMPDLLIRIKKKTDGSAALTCTRADGSVTWQRQDGQLGRFFPLHDLTHYAVESSLGFNQAFFGLVADGWDMSDFGKESTRGKAPEQAFLAELIVGFFDLERATGVIESVDAFNEKIVTWYRDNDRPVPTFRLAADDIERIRAVRAEIFAKWRALPPGEALEIPFDRSPQPAS